MSDIEPDAARAQLARAKSRIARLLARLLEQRAQDEAELRAKEELERTVRCAGCGMGAVHLSCPCCGLVAGARE